MLIKVERNKYINFLSKGENVRECRMKLEESVPEVNEKKQIFNYWIWWVFPTAVLHSRSLERGRI